MLSFLKSKPEASFPWQVIESPEHLESLLEGTTVFFKHSPRCFISRSVKSSFEAKAQIFDFNYYLINVIDQRDLSNLLAKHTQVVHQSPQLIVVKNKTCLHHSSHEGILASDVLEAFE
ncbi:MAG: bacillithiol system redox-active protein YtxJ [Flavobacteriales bacterium]